jgi:4-amino-4-deoxy-L-arabinose transferase-like glycosyltransferase
MKKLLILIFIFLLALALRFHTLSDFPKSLYWDEASIGYNAYSIIQTGKDEWGKNTPWFFEAFNEYKFPIPIYLTAISIKLFGENEFAVRFTSAFLGSFSVFALFAFVSLFLRTFFNSIFIERSRQKIAIMSAFLLAVSPWNIQFSRAMFESNLALFFELGYLFFVLKSLQQIKTANLFFLFLFFFLATYSYSIHLLFLPVITIFLIIICKKTFSKKVLFTTFFLIIIFVIELPFIFHVFNDGYSRFNQVSILNQNMALDDIVALRSKYGGLSKVVLNRYTAVIITLGENLLKHLNPLFLFPGTDGNIRHRSGGLIYFPEMFFLITGLSFLIKNKKNIIMMIIIIIIGYIPASLTLDAPHALRSLNVSPFILILIAIGITGFVSVLHKARTCIISTIIFIYFASITLYLLNYYKFYGKYSSSSWGIENKIMAIDSRKHVNNSEYVYITGDFWRPYIYYYFYNQINPNLVISNNNSTRVNNVWFGYSKFDKADRRFDYFFKPEGLINNNHKTVLYLSGSEKYFFHQILDMHHFKLSRIWKKSDGKDAIYKYEN